MNFLDGLVYEAAWAIESGLRKRAKLALKMEIFTTSYISDYKARNKDCRMSDWELLDRFVIGWEIPIEGSHRDISDYRNKLICIEHDPAGVLCKDNWTRFVSCYVRTVYKSGVTKFAWFHHIDSAKNYAEECESNDNCVEVIGPYNMPMGEGARFH